MKKISIDSHADAYHEIPGKIVNIIKMLYQGVNTKVTNTITEVFDIKDKCKARMCIISISFLSGNRLDYEANIGFKSEF